MNTKNNRNYTSNVDELVERTSLDSVLSHYGLPPTGQGKEYRMQCVFNEACSESQYGNLSIKLEAAKRIYAHCCGVRGNLLTLIHGLEARQPPTGGRLRGQEFKDALAKLKEINGGVPADTPASLPSKSIGSRNEHPAPVSRQVPNAVRGEENTPASVNVPLRKHENEAARALANLHEELITDTSQMPPAAAAYLRKREDWMTEELMRKWGVGWIPGNGRSLFRKSYIVYTHRNTRGDVVSYSGRDINFESKREKWLKANKPEGKKPNKYRYVSGFKRGAELYGGHASRLEEPHVRQSLEKNGLVVVEGANDVIRLDELGVCAVGLCSNRATAQQTELLAKFAQQVSQGRILLMPDCDDEGAAGFKDLLWDLTSLSLKVELGINRTQVDGAFDGFQPEDLTQEMWDSRIQ